MAQTEAWILPIGNGVSTAIGHHNMVEYLALENASIKAVPLVHPYASSILVWNKELLPVLDVCKFLHPHEKIQEDVKGVIIVAYQDAPGESLKNAAVILRASPVSVTVSTEMGCALPDSLELINTISDACFEMNEQQIPILKLENVFGSELSKVFAQTKSSQDQA